ncbi:MAG: hypothetical protein ABL974_14085 [Prosthecobacter sp.]
MKPRIHPLKLIVTTLLLSLAGLQAEDLASFTDRTVTDPLLVVNTSEVLLPAASDKLLSARRDDTSKPPMYKKALGKFNVLVVHPFGQQKPGSLDFSKITTQSKGKLSLAVRNHPHGDFILVLKKGAEVVEEKLMASGNWKTIVIPYDHQPIIAEVKANNWSFEHGFFDYSFSKN